MLVDDWDGKETKKTPGRRQLAQLAITIQVELLRASITTPSPRYSEPQCAHFCSANLSLTMRSRARILAPPPSVFCTG